MKPLLSICIPTYNRCEYLKKSIESIICQTEFENGEVEIVISDNASSDGTEVLGQYYSKRFKNINYFKNSKNIRDQNFPLVLSRASGMFRKLSNDTLVYQKNALSDLCKLIKEKVDNKPQIVILNGMNKNVKKGIIDCHDFNNFVDIASYWVTWIGAFGIWEDDCDDIENDLYGCDLLLWQVCKIYNLVLKSNNVIIYNKTVSTTQDVLKKDISYGIYKIFYVNYLFIVNSYVESGNLKSEIFDKIKKELLYDHFTYYIIYQEQNTHSMVFSKQENLKELVFKEYEHEEYWEEYNNYYKKKKITVKIKTILKKLHIWNLLVALHIRKQ